MLFSGRRGISSKKQTLAKSLARELTEAEQQIAAGGSCMLTYPPVRSYACDPNEN